jgi:hypothetical protein
MHITLLLSTSIMSEYFLLVYTLMHSIVGYVFINNTSAVLTYYLMIKRIIPLGILGICIRNITCECIRVFYATADADEEDVFFYEKGTEESEYDNDFDDGED